MPTAKQHAGLASHCSASWAFPKMGRALVSFRACLWKQRPRASCGRRMLSARFLSSAVKLAGESQGRKLRPGFSLKTGGAEFRVARNSDGEVIPASFLPSTWDLAFPSVTGR